MLVALINDMETAIEDVWAVVLTMVCIVLFFGIAVLFFILDHQKTSKEEARKERKEDYDDLAREKPGTAEPTQEERVHKWPQEPNEADNEITDSKYTLKD